VDVVEVRNGHYACVLQAALRMTNEAFAERLGIAPRTVAGWRANPDAVLRAETQQLLDEAYESVSSAVRKRFVLMLASEQKETEERCGPTVQPLRVAIAIVVRRGEVLLVCRRDDGLSGVGWQFPAGVIKPGGDPGDFERDKRALRCRPSTRHQTSSGHLCPMRVLPLRFPGRRGHQQGHRRECRRHVGGEFLRRTLHSHEYSLSSRPGSPEGAI